MMSRTIAVSLALLACQLACAQDDWPARMKGEWKSSATGRKGGAELELIAKESRDRARVKVTLTGTADEHGRECGFDPVETVEERSGGEWRLGFPSPYCSRSKWSMTIKPVQGKQRFEGSYTTDLPTAGSLWFDW